MRPSRNKTERKQPTPQELRDDCLRFIRTKFYAEQPLQFAKDHPKLLDWVVLWPAAWLDKRGVTITATRYYDIFSNVFLDAVRYGRQTKVTYLPAYLKQIIQSHFSHHGEDIYAEAKSMRAQVENALMLTGRLQHQAPDPVRDLAQAARLLRSRSPKKLTKNRPVNEQLTLL